MPRHLHRRSPFSMEQRNGVVRSPVRPYHPPDGGHAGKAGSRAQQINDRDFPERPFSYHGPFRDGRWRQRVGLQQDAALGFAQDLDDPVGTVLARREAHLHGGAGSLCDPGRWWVRRSERLLGGWRWVVALAIGRVRALVTVAQIAAQIRALVGWTAVPAMAGVLVSIEASDPAPEQGDDEDGAVSSRDHLSAPPRRRPTVLDQTTRPA